MSKLKKSPAQRKKRRIRLGVAVLALALIAIGSLGKGSHSVEAREVIEHHDVGQATVTNLEHKEVKYKLRRRTRISDVYTLEYTFQVDGKSHPRTLPIDEASFLLLQGKKELDVWYKPGQPEASAPESVWRSRAAETSFLGNALGLGVIIVPGAFIVQMFLVFFFAREPKGAVPEGFVTETSWLDIDDHKLVVLDGEHLVIASFNSKRSKEVQAAYQRGAELSLLLKEGESRDPARVPIASITGIETRHHADDFTLTFGGDGKTVSADFLTPAVKDHALQRLTARLPLKRTDEQLTRMQGVMPSGIGLVICAALGWFLQTNVALMALASLAGLFALKILVTRLIDPPLVSRWSPKQDRPSLRPASAS